MSAAIQYQYSVLGTKIPVISKHLTATYNVTDNNVMTSTKTL